MFLVVMKYSRLPEITKDGLACCYGHRAGGVNCAVVEVFARCWVCGFCGCEFVEDGFIVVVEA